MKYEGKRKQAAVVCCSDGLGQQQCRQTDRLCGKLMAMGLEPVVSPLLARGETIFSGTPLQRAQVLMDCYQDPGIGEIFDVSGGNLANQILEYLDFDCIRRSRKHFWGYSDLTVMLNALWTKTGNRGWLYQVRNLVGSQGEEQEIRFRDTVLNGGQGLLPDDWEFLQGDRMEGLILGGNIRCFLKLAGTEYFPDLTGSLLFLESYGGGVGVTASLLAQLRQMGVFSRIRGLLLGTFTEMETSGAVPDVRQLALEAVGNPRLPVAVTRLAGHGPDSRAIPIGAECRVLSRSFAVL